MYNYESSENRGYVKEETQDRTLRKAIFQAWWQKRHRRVNCGEATNLGKPGQKLSWNLRVERASGTMLKAVANAKGG